MAKEGLGTTENFKAEVIKGDCPPSGMGTVPLGARIVGVKLGEKHFDIVLPPDAKIIVDGKEV